MNFDTSFQKAYAHGSLGVNKRTQSLFFFLLILKLYLFRAVLGLPCCMDFPLYMISVISSVELLSLIRLFATPWTAAHQASLSITNTWSLLKLMSIELVMPSNHLILCHPLLLQPPFFSSIIVFSNESALQVPKALEFQL